MINIEKLIIPTIPGDRTSSPASKRIRENWDRKVKLAIVEQLERIADCLEHPLRKVKLGPVIK